MNTVICWATVIVVVIFQSNIASAQLGAKDILGNPECLAISYGGYRHQTRDSVPSVDQLKEDMRILSAMGIQLLRTYNTQQYAHAANLLEAIRQLRSEDPRFEMYVMLGAWIDCEGAWGPNANHETGNVQNNTAEINAAVKLASEYPEVVKIIAVGNEAMVHWATSYFVRPGVILKWVEHLQTLKRNGKLAREIWITSSDNFASWGGGDASYHTDDLTSLINAVDYVSLHTYPFHDTHYNSDFWIASEDQANLSVTDGAKAAVQRASAYAAAQHQSVSDYIASLGIEKPIHIGETGWASIASSLYGDPGSHAADQYKQKLYYQAMRDWTKRAGMSCFFFEAFDERWKDAENALGSENHFGLINLDGQAKYVLWDQVDSGVFDGLTRGGVPITKTFGGDESALLKSVLRVPAAADHGSQRILTVNEKRDAGELVGESKYVIVHGSLIPNVTNDMTYPSAPLKLNVWEGTCGMSLSGEGEIQISTGTGQWWGCALEIEAEGNGENLSEFKSGTINFEIKGETKTPFTIGFQSGLFAAGTQTNNSVTFNVPGKRQLSHQWNSWSIPIPELDQRADYADVTSVLFVRGDNGLDGKAIEIRNVYYSRD